MDKIPTVLGIVVDGAKLGRKLGFPTANIKFSDSIEIKEGVWLTKLTLEGDSFYGVANWGTKPTVDSTLTPNLEVFIFDFNQEIYSKEVEVSFISFLREVERFASLEELTAAIQSDVLRAKELIKTVYINN